MPIPDKSARTGIRRFTTAEGPDAGLEVVEIATDGGLTFDMRPARSFDIGRFGCAGTAYAWIGPDGLGAGPLSRDMGGMFFTCGFDHIRQPETVADPVTGRPVAYPLHGNLPFTTARVTRMNRSGDGNGERLVCSGMLEHATAGGRYRLERTYDVAVAGTEVSIVDRVTNVADRPLPLMAMYHFNIGAPLLGPGTTVRMSGGAVHPVPPPLPGGTATGQAPQSWDVYRPAADADGWCGAVIASADEVRPLRITWDAGPLPYLQIWRNRDSAVDVLSVEPASHRRASRSELQAAGEIAMLAPAETAVLRLRLGIDAPG